MSTTTSSSSPGAGVGDDRGAPLNVPTPPAPSAPPPLTGFAAGATGVALLAVGVWGLHLFSSAGGLSVSAGSVVLLLAAFTALGKGITLIQRALAPITAAAGAAVSGVPALVRALAAMVVGAAGVWWVLRGHAAIWWAHTTDAGPGWTLISALVQVALIAAAGTLLFGGAKDLVALRSSGQGTRHRSDRWASWWASRPGLGLMLLAGAAAIVLLSGYVVPRVSGWLLGGDLKAALAVIVAILIAGLLANTWWWGALSGWWAWVHRPHAPGGGATPMGQIYAGAGVVALVWFSATAFGLTVPDSYTGPGAMPRAHADCPPDCGGGSSGSGSSGPAFPMQPPDMPSPPGGYNSGSYPAPDQANGISIDNPSTGQNGPAQGGYSQYPAQGQPGPPANGVQPPNYDAPAQQPGQAPAQRQPQQGPAQQGPQQPAEQQPEGQPGQDNQPAQPQPQRPAQQRQHTNQQLPKFPSNDKKKDDTKQDRDSQSGDTDLSTLLFGAVSSGRRRKQGHGPDEPQEPDQEEQAPDTSALTQDGAQAAQGIPGDVHLNEEVNASRSQGPDVQALTGDAVDAGQSVPGDVSTYVQSGQGIAQSSGQAAQGFSSAAEAGASIASSAQSGAVNPEDAITLVQGVSQGIQGTADAINSGSQIVKTAQGEADHVAQAVGDVNPQLKPQAEQFTQLNDQASQVTDLVGQGAELTSQGAGAVNTVSSLGAGGTPTDAASQTGTVELMSGTVPDPGGQGRVDVPSILQKVGDTGPPPKQSVDVSSLNRVGVTQQKKFADPHAPSINDSFEKVAPTPGDSFDLGVYSNGQMWTGDYYQTAGADQGGRGGMYRIPVSSDGKTATGSPVRVAPPAHNPDGSPRNPASRLLPTGKADLGNGHDLVFASQVPWACQMVCVSPVNGRIAGRDNRQGHGWGAGGGGLHGADG